jgi:hypothetical protein
MPSDTKLVPLEENGQRHTTPPQEAHIKRSLQR